MRGYNNFCKAGGIVLGSPEHRSARFRVVHDLIAGIIGLTILMFWSVPAGSPRLLLVSACFLGFFLIANWVYEHTLYPWIFLVLVLIALGLCIFFFAGLAGWDFSAVFWRGDRLRLGALFCGFSISLFLHNWVRLFCGRSSQGSSDRIIYFLWLIALAGGALLLAYFIEVLQQMARFFRLS